MKEIAAKILAAALRLFARKGYAATTVRQIVDEADVTNPMLYYYFDSKQGVFLALIEVLFEAMSETVDDIMDEHDDVRVQLREVGTAYFEGCRQSPEILQFIYAAMFGPAESCPTFDVPEAHGQARDRIEASICDAIADGTLNPPEGFDAEFLTERYLGLIDNHLIGALSLFAHDRSYVESRQSLHDYLSEEALDEMMRFFLHAAGASPQEGR